MNDTVISEQIEVIAVNTYRSTPEVNKSDDRARVVLDLQFPRDIALFKQLRSRVTKKQTKGA